MKHCIVLKKIIGIDEKICIFSKNILNLFFDQLKFNSIDKIKSNYATKNLINAIFEIEFIT